MKMPQKNCGIFIDIIFFQHNDKASLKKDALWYIHETV